MSRVQILQKLMHRHRYQLLFTYLLFSLEMAGALLRPYFLGVAVNDLIAGRYDGLVVLSLVHLGWLLIGTLRHMYDTRTYSAIYMSLVTRFIARRRQRADVSKLSAHSTLSREFVDFLEFDLVYVLEAVFNILGSLLMLYFYDSAVVGICMLILIPVSVISFVYGKKMKTLTRYKNDELEKQVSIIGSADPEKIRGHFNQLRTWQVRISDKEAWSFGLIEFLVMLVIGISLMVSSGVFGTSIMAGSVIGIYNYILKFVSGIETIPYTVQRLTSLNDITRRIELEDDDFSEKDYPASTKLTKVSMTGQMDLFAA